VFSHFSKLALALAIMGALGITRFAMAGHPHNVPQKEHFTGTLTATTATSLQFASTGTGTHFGKYSITGGNNIVPNPMNPLTGLVTDGTFTTKTADEATITGIFSGTYTVLGPDSIRFDVVVHWQPGTGRLAGVTGQGNVVAFLDGNTAGSHFEYFTDGFLVFP
jgi:hypothetical protein